MDRPFHSGSCPPPALSVPAAALLRAECYSGGPGQVALEPGFWVSTARLAEHTPSPRVALGGHHCRGSPGQVLSLSSSCPPKVFSRLEDQEKAAYFTRINTSWPCLWSFLDVAEFNLLELLRTLCLRS